MRYLLDTNVLSLDCVVVTGNARKFGRVAGLRMENWLA